MSLFSLSGSRKDAGGNRGLKQKTSIFLAKYRAKKNKRNAKKQRTLAKKNNLKTETDTIPEKEPVTYGLGKSSGICKEVKIIISRSSKNADTLLVYFPDYARSLSDEEKEGLKKYVNKVSADSITAIVIKNCHTKNILTEHEIICTEERERKISKFFKTLSVPRSKIKSED